MFKRPGHGHANTGGREDPIPCFKTRLKLIFGFVDRVLA